MFGMVSTDNRIKSARLAGSLTFSEMEKVFAFCANGTPKSIQTLLSLAKENGEDELVFQTLLQCMSFSDQLLAYHEPELCDELCDQLKEMISAESGVKDEVKQAIWRVLVVGWFKFARNASSALELLQLFVSQSKQ